MDQTGLAAGRDGGSACADKYMKPVNSIEGSIR
jgi:hypothetical protein